MFAAEEVVRFRGVQREVGGQRGSLVKIRSGQQAENIQVCVFKINEDLRHKRVVEGSRWCFWSRRNWTGEFSQLYKINIYNNPYINLTVVCLSVCPFVRLSACPLRFVTFFQWIMARPNQVKTSRNFQDNFLGVSQDDL